MTKRKARNERKGPDSKSRKTVGLQRIGKGLWVSKVPADPKRKTYRWTAFSNNHEALGTVYWYPPQSKYCFAPHSGAVIEQDCLRDLAAFLYVENICGGYERPTHTSEQIGGALMILAKSANLTLDTFIHESPEEPK